MQCNVRQHTTAAAPFIAAARRSLRRLALSASTVHITTSLAGLKSLEDLSIVCLDEDGELSLADDPVPFFPSASLTRLEQGSVEDIEAQVRWARQPACSL